MADDGNFLVRISNFLFPSNEGLDRFTEFFTKVTGSILIFFSGNQFVLPKPISLHKISWFDFCFISLGILLFSSQIATNWALNSGRSTKLLNWICISVSILAIQACVLSNMGVLATFCLGILAVVVFVCACLSSNRRRRRRQGARGPDMV